MLLNALSSKISPSIAEPRFVPASYPTQAMWREMNTGTDEAFDVICKIAAKLGCRHPTEPTCAAIRYDSLTGYRMPRKCYEFTAPAIATLC